MTHRGSFTCIYFTHIMYVNCLLYLLPFSVISRLYSTRTLLYSLSDIYNGPRDAVFYWTSFAHFLHICSDFKSELQQCPLPSELDYNGTHKIGESLYIRKNYGCTEYSISIRIRPKSTPKLHRNRIINYLWDSECKLNFGQTFFLYEK